ncbi:uncharacterized protein LOC135200262 [Macrobrachium nipponense]|uniref:uncharacterized protein LOC135200262 n=1 Tax=Macrobrachium nipponense TaxID=159736 RepID=UPI0030C8A94E
MKSLRFMSLALALLMTTAKTSNIPDPNGLYTKVFSMTYNMGTWSELNTYTPDLSTKGMDNDIESVHQTGMWIYYENQDYNTVFQGKIYYVHGIEYSMDFPTQYRNMASSARFAGHRDVLNADAWNIYEGQYFAGRELFGTNDEASLGELDLQASSIVVTGTSAWTVYTGQSFTGQGVCVYPDTVHDHGPSGEQLDVGIFGVVTALGLPEDSIRSIRKGCWSSKVATPSDLSYQHKDSNGGWGYVEF